MIVESVNIISESLTEDNTIAEGIRFMEELGVEEIPISNGQRFIKIIRLQDALLEESSDTLIKNIEGLGNCIFARDPWLDALVIMNTNEIGILPVLNNAKEYLGFITKQSLIDLLCNSISFNMDGCTVVLHQNILNYSFTELSHYIDQEGIRLLGLVVCQIEETNDVWITIKLNSFSLGNLLTTLEKRGYKVISQYSLNPHNDLIKERYDSFMTLINI